MLSGAAENLISTVRRLLPQNRFARSVSVLAGGTAAGQAIVVAASPILTRLYSPEDFGVLAVFASLLGMLTVIASLRYQLAIPLPQNDEEAANITMLSLIVALGISLITAALVIPLRQPIAEALNTPMLASYIWLVPLGLLLTGIYQVLNYWAIRTKAFGVIARTRLIQSVGMVVVQIGGYALGPVALLIGRVFGQAAGISRFVRMVRTTHRGLWQSVGFRSLAMSAKEYRAFPLQSTWTGLASSGGVHLPPLLIASFLGAGPAGLYALTHRVLSVPMTVVGKAVGDVFYQEAAEAHRGERLAPLVAGVNSKLIEVALPIAVVVFLVSPAAFSLIFGATWKEAGLVARWMVPWIFFQFVTTPPTRVFPIIGRHGSALILQASLLTSGVLSVSVGAIYFNSLVAVIVILSLSNSMIYLIRLMLTYRLVGGSAKTPWKIIVSNLPMAALAALPLGLYELFYGDGISEFPWLWALMALVSLSISVIPLGRSYIRERRPKL